MAAASTTMRWRVRKVPRGTTMNVQLNVKLTKEFHMRVWLAKALIKIAARILGAAIVLESKGNDAKDTRDISRA